MESKNLYSFTLFSEKENSVEEKRIDEQTKEEITVIKKVTEKVPFEIILKKPTRRQIEEADLEYSVEMSKCIKKGVLTKAMLAKKYSDTGGMLSENESKKLVDLYKKIYDLQNENIRLESSTKKKDNKEKIDNVVKEITKTRKEIIDIESNYRSLFDHTADTKAQNKLLLWYILNITYYKADPDSEEKPYFKGEEFEDKLQSFYEKEEESVDDNYAIISKKVSTLVAFWFFNQASSFKDFEELDKKIESGEL
jgi:hypothetical protein